MIVNGGIIYLFFIAIIAIIAIKRINENGSKAQTYSQNELKKLFLVVASFLAITSILIWMIIEISDNGEQNKWTAISGIVDIIGLMIIILGYQTVFEEIKARRHERTERFYNTLHLVMDRYLDAGFYNSADYLLKNSSKSVHDLEFKLIENIINVLNALTIIQMLIEDNMLNEDHLYIIGKFKLQRISKAVTTIIDSNDLIWDDYGNALKLLKNVELRYEQEIESFRKKHAK